MNARVFAVCVFGLALPMSGQTDPEPKAEVQTWRMRGRAVDEQGKPIEGVSAALVPSREWTTAGALANPRTKTGADGRFELTLEAANSPAEWRTPLLAAPGWTTALLHADGVDVTPSASNPAIDVGDIVLCPAVTLRGRVRTADGRPFAGAHVVASDLLMRLGMTAWGQSSSPTYSSAARTRDDGAFELSGVAADGVRLAITGAGHHRRELPFVLAGDPLVVELVPSGFVEGIVKDANGQPCHDASVWLSYVSGEREGDNEEVGEVGADGTFRLTLELPGPYRIEAFAGDFHSFGGKPRGALLDGPAKGIELTTGANIDPQRALVVRIVDAATGKAVEAVRAAAFWREPAMLEHMQGRHFGFDELVAYRAPGEIRLPGPGEDEPETGMVKVEAEGYAPLVLADIEWSDANPPRLEARLVRESVLTGVVTDARTGEPVEGAVVLIGADADMQPWILHSAIAEADPGRAITAADGRFRIGGLVAGKHRLRALHLRRPRGEPIEVEVGAAETQADVKLTSPAGSAVTGKLTGAEPGAGWEVRLRAIRGARDAFRSSDLDEWTMPRSPVAADGSFGFAGLEPGIYELRLSMPHRGGRCGHVDVTVDPLRIRTNDLKRDFDVSEALPGTIRGRVTVAGAELPHQRLAIAVFPPPGEGEFRWRQQPYVVESLAADGTFALPAIPGEQRLEVLDLATGIPLAMREGVKVATGETTELDLRVELVTVRVRLRPEQEGGSVVASWLEVAVQHERRQVEREGFMVGGFDQDNGIGVALGGRADDLELLLPPVSTKFVVRSNHARVYEGEWETPPLGEAELTPKKATADRIEIVVRTPPKPEGK